MVRAWSRVQAVRASQFLNRLRADVTADSPLGGHTVGLSFNDNQRLLQIKFINERNCNADLKAILGIDGRTDRIQRPAIDAER